MEKSNYNLGVGIFLIAYHVFLLISLPIYFMYYTPSVGVIIAAIVLYFASGMAITGGYHRFYSHKTYKTHPLIEFILLFFGSMAVQGSALRWSFDHRLHHAHVDTDKDPYSIKKGFLYAHFLWLFQKPAEIDNKIVSDLLKNKFVAFQERHSILLMLVTNLMAFGFVGWLCNDYMGAFMIACWTRLFALHHSTWFINSLAHTWGDKPFCQEQSAVNNYIISFLTFGEGYHNYHHTFANDYRNGIRWYHFDPTKWLIWTLSKFGLARDLKKMDWYSVRKRMVQQRKMLLTERLEKLWYVKKEEMQQMLNEVSERILSQISTISNLNETYYKLKTECAQQDILKQLQTELKNLQRNVRQDWRLWMQISRHIMRMKPLAN